MSPVSAPAQPRVATPTQHPPAAGQAPAPNPHEQMMQMLTGAWVARSISAAARLRLADHVTDQPRSAEEIAAATNTHAPSVYRLLRALAGVGIFAEDVHRRFRHTPLSEILRTNAPGGSMRAIADSIFGGCQYRSWGDLEHSVRTGGIACDHVFGVDVWAYFAGNPREQQAFDDAMSEFTAMFNPPVVRAYDYSRFGTLVDVGGGHGALLAAIARANPALRGTVYDQPHVVPGARQRFADENLADRCGAEAGNFFESVPAGADAYLMKLIVHDWDDLRAATILRNVHRAARPGARLLVVDSVVPPGPGPDFSKFADVNMLVMTGGRERTESEFRHLFAAAGFDLLAVHPTDGPLSIVEGVRR